jgi:biopolymer transport protein ExbD
MHLRAKYTDDSPDINFIPLIDVLLVIVIFLAVSTTFTQERALDILLPQAQSDVEIPQAINLTISADGQVAIDQQVLEIVTIDNMVAALTRSQAGQSNSIVVIRADANATHQSVVSAMQAARLAGIEKISLAAQVSD